jgi:folate-dependent phosphoribosylglycinamide formyltransferase PurN
MQKSLSIILANTNRSKFYFNELKKNKFFLENIIFYSTKKNLEFLKILKKYPYKNDLQIIMSNDVNNKIIETEILKIKSKYILFSGYNAELLKNKNILKKNLIHCHPGLLPKYRGSTVVYYSMIEIKKIYVSIFKISKNIDEGKVLFTKYFSFPKNKIDLEKNFDHIIRAKTLVSFLKSNKIILNKQKDRFPNFYYIAHPLIRSIVLNPKSLLKEISINDY